MYLPTGEALDDLDVALHNLRLTHRRWSRPLRRVHWPAAAFGSMAPNPGFALSTRLQAWPGRQVSGPPSGYYPGVVSADVPEDLPEPMPIPRPAGPPGSNVRTEIEQLRRTNAILKSQIDANQNENRQRMKDLWWDKVLPMVVMGVGGLIGTVLTIWITTRVSASAKKALLEERIAEEKEARDDQEYETQRRITKHVVEEV